MDAELRAAIASGAPLYNAGDASGCVAVYRAAAARLLGTTEPAAAERLRAALQEADAVTSHSDAAWALRHAFDDLLASAPGPALLEFTNAMPEGVAFETIHDTVMGGASSGALRHDAARGVALFAGVVSTSGGGGFASFRSSARSWPASAAGVVVVAKAADGLVREYKVTARTDDAWDGVGYQATFVVGAAAETHQLPFSAFRATFRGRDVPGAPPLRGSSLRRLGLMLSRFDAAGKPLPSFVPGAFALELHALGTFS